MEILFSVHDTGIGIEKKEKEHIFSRFTQADSSSTRKYGGTGLGLTISRKIVREMGGDISVESTPGQGSTFSFQAVFPLVSEGEIKERETVFSGDLSGIKILAVDDNPTNLLILDEILGSMGARVRKASGGEEALGEFEKAGEEFDLLIVDCFMPEMDGLELIRRIRKKEEGKDLPVILLSSDPFNREGCRGGEYLADTYMVKPVRREDLFWSIGGVLEKREPTETSADKPQEQLPLKILLAEDSPDNRMLIRAFLKSTSHTLIHAENGEEALREFAAQKPDLVLMDIQMPVMDGYTATREIREKERAEGLVPTPIIALTAHVLDTDLEKAREAGCDEHMGKPVKKQKLLDLLQRYAQKKG